MAVPVTAQQLAEAAVKAADHGDRRERILHGIDVSPAVAVEVARHQALERGDLREARQRLKPVSSVGLAQEDPAAKLGRGKALGGGEPVLTHEFPQGGPGVKVVLGIAPQDRGNLEAQFLAGAPREQALALVIRLDQRGCAGAGGGDPGEDQRRVLRARAILRVQPDVADHVIRAAVAIEIRRGDRGPPAGARRGKTRALGPVRQAPPLLVVETLHLAPLQREQQIRPTVAVDVAPQGGGHHANGAQPGRERVSHILKPAASVGEKFAPRRARILAGQHPGTEKDSEMAGPVEVGRRRGSHAEAEGRQGSGRRRPQGAVAIVEKKPWLILGNTGGQAGPGPGHEHIIVPVIVRIKDQHWAVGERRTARELGGGERRELARSAHHNPGGIGRGAANQDIVLPVTVKVTHRQARAPVEKPRR